MYLFPCTSLRVLFFHVSQFIAQLAMNSLLLLAVQMVVYPPWNKLDTELVSFLEAFQAVRWTTDSCLNECTVFCFFDGTRDAWATRKTGFWLFGFLLGTLLRTCAGIIIVEQTIIGILLTWTTSIVTGILRASHGASKKECAGCVEQYAQWSLFSTWIDPTIEYTVYMWQSCTDFLKCDVLVAWGSYQVGTC